MPNYASLHRLAGREEFLQVRKEFLTARPITSPEHLKGREKALLALTDALRTPGKHAFIYGYRGVGKTSLAQTAAYQIQHSAGVPVIVGCEPGSTFESVVLDIVRRALAIDPLEKKGQTKLAIGGGLPQLGSANFSFDKNYTPNEIRINNVSDAISYLDAACKRFTFGFTVLVDEFDQLKNQQCHARFANLLKQVNDQGLSVKFIFCGIAETVEDLFSSHESIFRQIHTTSVDPLPLQARIDILDDAAEALQISLRSDFKYRISQISDGFPSFVHLIAEKVFTCAYDRNGCDVDRDSYDEGLIEAVQSVEFKLKRAYENALHKNTHKYEHVIWAAAGHKFFDVNVDIVWNNYIDVCHQIGEQPLGRANINTKLNQLTTPEYGSILEKVRRSNYTFTEKMMRGYARLRAERHGCVLGEENPGLAKVKK